MELVLTLLLAAAVSILATLKIHDLILIIQGFVISMAITVFLHTSLTYFAYALIYVYVGAICVLFLYFMMLLQNKWESSGELWNISHSTEYFIILSVFAWATPLAKPIIENENSSSMINVGEQLLLNNQIIFILILLLFLGLIIPIMLTINKKIQAKPAFVSKVVKSKIVFTNFNKDLSI